MSVRMNVTKCVLRQDAYNARAGLARYECAAICPKCRRGIEFFASIPIEHIAFRDRERFYVTDVLPQLLRLCDCDRHRCRIGAQVMRKSGRVFIVKRGGEP